MKNFRKGACGVLIAAAFSGAAIAAPCDGPIDMRPLDAGAPLTLAGAFEQIRAASPEVRRAALETRARQAEADQAGKRLNPSIGLEMENFSGSGPLNGFDQVETTLSLEQTFELGGKRAKRERAALAAAALSSAECKAILRETELQASLLFFELKAAQELAVYAQESADLSAQLTETVSKRVDAGAAAPPELSRVQAEQASVKAAALRARANVDQTKYDLAALWGSDEPVFTPPLDKAIYTLNTLGAVEDLNSHPALAVARADTDARALQQEAARSVGVPNLTVSAGLRRFEESGDNALLLGFSVPLPIFDRNKDAARAAGYRADSARINTVATKARLRSQQQAAMSQLRVSQARLDLLEKEALPAARSAYEASLTGYSAGRFNLTTTLDARKSLLDAGVSVIDARRTFNADMMRLNSLIGAAPFDGDL